MEKLEFNNEIDKSSSYANSDSVPNPVKNSDGPLGEWLRFAIIALLIVLPIRWFVALPFIVSGASMEDTFHNNEYLIVDQLTYKFEHPERGDVIVFRYPRDPSKYFIKRVIGLPGETVKIEDGMVIIESDEYPGGLVLYEPYAETMNRTSNLTQELGEGEYFVMGDNRDSSSDSRVWGALPESKIVGRALLRLFPLNEIGLFPGSYDADKDALRANSS